MVIFFFCGGKRGSVRILRDFKDNYEKYAALKTRVLAVSTEDREELGKLADELNLPFPLFSDTSLEMTSKYTYLDSTTKCPMPSVFITDRFAALYEQRIAEREVDLPDQEEILDWLHFIAMQCPECGVDARINERLVG